MVDVPVGEREPEKTDAPTACEVPTPRDGTVANPAPPTVRTRLDLTSQLPYNECISFPSQWPRPEGNAPGVSVQSRSHGVAAPLPPKPAENRQCLYPAGRVRPPRS